MKVILTKENPQLESVLKSIFFQELILILNESESPTLREIKQKVTDSKLDWKIDFLVKEKIIQRQDKRYSLLLPIAKREESTNYQEIKQRVFDCLNELTIEDKKRTLCALYPKEAMQDPFLLDKRSPFTYYQQTANDLLTIVSLSTQEVAFNLPNYFKQQLKGQESSAFEAVEALLGDVDTSYYLDQIWAILEKIRKNRRRIRESIFLNSLHLFQIIEQTDDYWKLAVPVQAFMENKTPALPFSDEFSNLSLIEQRSLLAELMISFDLENMTILFINR